MATGLLNLPIASRKEWLATFHNTFPPYVFEDDAATTFASCGAILLTSLLFNTEDPRVLADLITLPLDFVYLVCEKAAQTKFCGLSAWCTWPEYFHKHPGLREIEDSLMNVKEGYGDFVWSRQLVLVLERLRDGMLVGGQHQRWVDRGYKYEFGTLQLYLAPAQSRVH